MTLRIYIAGSSREIPRVRAAMLAAIEAGYSLTCDWTLAHRPTRELDTCARADAATECLGALDRAEVLWLLAPLERSDALWEAGYAQGLQSCGAGPDLIIVSGPVEARGIFAAHCTETETDAEALRVLRAWAGEGEEALDSKRESPAAVVRPGLGQA